MIPKKLLIAFILFLGIIKVNGQTRTEYFKVIDSIVLTEVTSNNLQTKLDSLKSKFIPTINNFPLLSFDRDIDFAFRHQRFSIEMMTNELNFQNFQIDLLTRNDTIFARTIRHCEWDTTLNFDSSYSSEKVDEYLTQRNKFYKSQKTTKDLIREISDYRVFAFYCGYGSTLTEEGTQVNEIVAEKKTEELFQMLQSICIETQAYGVSGFKLLKKKWSCNSFRHSQNNQVHQKKKF